ncbi:FliH/SctL family protein [Cellulomonas sp. P22]|uniref:FliH/SctL family protein n=1 Tax=Cellulomonas sp. P22 TaxID=3373189 RepID=UPI00378F4720
MSPEVRGAVFERVVMGAAPDGARESARTAELERARAAGYAAGFAAGMRDAAQAAQAEAGRVARELEVAASRRAAEHAAALVTLERAALAAQARTVPVIDELERRLQRAALELAQAVLGHELRDGEHGARAALARALEDHQQVGPQTVRMNPRDLDVLVAADAVPDVAGLTFVPDAMLAVGDAVSEHPDGYLDARLTTALERLRAVLAEPGA